MASDRKTNELALLSNALLDSPLEFVPSLDENVDEDTVYALENDNIDENQEKLSEFQIKIDELFAHLFISGVTRDVLDYIAKSINGLMETVNTAVVDKIHNEKDRTEVTFVFDVIHETIKSKFGRCKRKSSMKKSRFYVDPVPVSLGSQLKSIRKGYRQQIINKSLVLQKVPIKKTIEALFRSKNFKDAFFSSTHICQPGVYKGVCCGSQYQQSSLRTSKYPMIIYLSNTNLIFKNFLSLFHDFGNFLYMSK